jgi:hypothetical protein
MWDYLVEAARRGRREEKGGERRKKGKREEGEVLTDKSPAA